MEEFITRASGVILITIYTYSDILSTRTLFWSLLLLIMQISITIMYPASVEKHITKKEMICLMLYCLYLICGFAFSTMVEYFWSFIIVFIITSGLMALRYSPPYVLEKTGYGGIVRIFLEGWFWVILHSIALSEHPKFLVIQYMPVFLVQEAWYLIKELNESSEDIKNKYITTGILMGKYGCFKIFLMLHTFSWICLLLDMKLDYLYGAPLLIIPWALFQIKKLKTLDSTHARTQAFMYYLAFCALTTVPYLKN